MKVIDLLKWLSIIIILINVLKGIIMTFTEDELEDRIISFISTLLVSFILYYLIIK